MMRFSPLPQLNRNQELRKGKIMNGLKEISIECPYCGERLRLLIDCSVTKQSYIEDCQICCKPMQIEVQVNSRGIPKVNVKES